MVPKERTSSSGHKLKYSILHSNIRKPFFMVCVAKHWNRLSAWGVDKQSTGPFQLTSDSVTLWVMPEFTVWNYERYWFVSHLSGFIYSCINKIYFISTLYWKWLYFVSHLLFIFLNPQFSALEDLVRTAKC